MFKILGPRVFIKYLDMPSITSKLIYIPETVEQDQSQLGIVLAVGNGERTENGRRKIPVNVGDVIVVRKYSSAPVNTVVNGEEIEGFIVFEDDILAIVEGL